MILEQYYLGCLAHASYLIGDTTSGVAAVVDPQRDVDQYLADAARVGVEIRFAFLTHFHADFVAGHLELRDRTGAEICLGARAEAEYGFRPFASGDTLELGPEVRVEVLETPGHSPESITILVHDLERAGDGPYAALTGDTLFIGDVGRPDLRAALGWTAEELGGLLYDSVHEKLLPLPDDTLVYPGHGAGSLCGKNLSTDTVSTIGVQRRYNYALQPMSRDEFVRIVTADQPDSPSYFTYDAILNTKERPTLDAALEQALAPLEVDEVLRLEAEGAHLLDVRPAADFAGAHLRGSVSIGLDGSFATWAGTVLDPSHPIVVIADPGRENEAATRLGRIGFDNVAGYLAGGMQALEPRPELVSRIERITAPTLAEQLEHDPRPFVLDVRTDGERKQGSIAGSVHIPLPHLLEELDAVPADRDVVVVCGSGYRSSIATSLLQRSGLERVTDMIGGMGAWSASRLATGTPA
jgi:glyoxylase-like metal-dependent hydrolase (beta-lactamase superfamily II)/rhodanese-related sulfurtransferase